MELSVLLSMMQDEKQTSNETNYTQLQTTKSRYLVVHVSYNYYY